MNFKVSKAEKKKNQRKKKRREIEKTERQEHLYLVSRLLESRPSFTHYLPVNCEHRAGCVCVRGDVCVCVCLSHTLTVIYSSSHTLPFCLLVNGHGEGGYNGRLRSPINLDTSYHCLPLQGEACPVANMINPLPLCPQPLTHTPSNLLPLTRGHAAGKKKTQGLLHTSEARNLLELPFLPYTGNN